MTMQPCTMSGWGREGHGSTTEPSSSESGEPGAPLCPSPTTLVVSRTTIAAKVASTPCYRTPATRCFHVLGDRRRVHGTHLTLQPEDSSRPPPPPPLASYNCGFESWWVVCCRCLSPLTAQQSPPHATTMAHQSRCTPPGRSSCRSLWRVTGSPQACRSVIHCRSSR